MGKIVNDLASFCTPAKIYLALGLIALVAQLGLVVFSLLQGKLKAGKTALSVVSLGLYLLFVLGYSAALDKFCTWGWSPLSWLLVLVPILVALLTFMKLFPIVGRMRI